MSKKDYTQLKAMLEEQEEFPIDFMHKFIGKNTAPFIQSVADFERNFPKALRQAERSSQGGAHVALTYILRASSSDEIIEMLKATELIVDLIIVL